MEDDQLRNPDAIIAKGLIHQATIESLLELCCRIAAKSGITEIDGLPIHDFFQKLKIAKLEEILIGLENIDPALAARFQEYIDRSKGKSN